LLPEAVRMTADPHTNPHAYLQRLTRRLVKAACRMAVRYDLNGGFGAFVRFALDATAGGDEVVRAAAAENLGELFAALRKLGLTDLAGELAGAWADRPIGWFVMGRDDTGWALLDAARERLFVTAFADDRGRTDAAFEYVDALAHAPPRLALGRLEELFQRLGGVVTAGATARHFALTPLELIDRAVSAVVTDEFNLGPAVRRWLDDDEFVIRRRIARDLEAALARDVPLP
jgi:cellulose synthase operon protein C